MPAPQAYPRKRLFVNREIQGRLLARIALYWLLYHGVLWMAMFFHRYAEYRGAVLAGAEPRSFANLYGQFVQEHLSMWFCAAAILPIVLWDFLKFSHRVAGPLVRFQRTLESLAAGETVHEVRLRRGDLLMDLQASFNQYLASLRTLQAEREISPQPKNAIQCDDRNDMIESQLAEELQRMQSEIQAACSPAKTASQTAAR